MRFLKKSTNHHGVHSPFIYDFVTTVFYNKKKQLSTNSSKKTAFFERFIEHLTIQSLTAYGTINLEIKKCIAAQNIKQISINKLQNYTSDCLYISKNAKLNTISTETLLKALHNNSVIVFEDIYHNKRRTLYWQKLSEHKETTAIIDGFYFGFIFLRKEQKKQTFTIRM